MSDKIKPPTLFWIVGALFLLWNAFGCYLYYMDNTMSDAAYVEAYGQAMTDVRGTYPAWSMAGYAIGVWGGLVAAILFLLRKKLALPLFILSVIGAFVSFIWGFTNADYKAAAGSSFWVMPVIVLAIGAFEIWVTRKKIAKGILT